jgi:hypothetical protein
MLDVKMALCFLRKMFMIVNAIDRVIEQISSLKKEMHADMHDLKAGMNKQFSSLGNRVIAIETKLDTANEIPWLNHAKLIDYSFQTASLLLGAILTYVVIHFHALIK